MEHTKKLKDDIEKAFCNIRIVYSIILKLQKNGYRYTPAEGILLSGIMKEKSLESIHRLRQYCEGVKDIHSDTVPVMVGTFNAGKQGFTFL